MSGAEGTFSESWYRIGERRITLRPHVRLTRQMFRGEKWHVLHDPFGLQFFRLRPAVYEFVARLSRARTVDAVWRDCLRRFPDDAPGQQEVVQLLAQLFYANLIQSDEPADSARLFERYRKRKRREIGSRLLNVMFARFHLLDPSRFLTAALPLVRPLLSPVGLAVWFVAMLLGVKAVVDHAPEFIGQTQGVLAPGNLPLLYLAIVLVKTLHEFGHAFICRRFGGEVHDMGIMLLIFTPLPYVNATAAWAFRERWKRVLVGMAGMMVELFVAALAAMVWAAAGPGTLRALAYNMVIVASVSTIVFNANPLLRYDGYYILSDLLDVPNLHQRASRMWRYWLERHVFGMREETAVEKPTARTRDAVGLAVFGALAAVYRVIVFGGILLVVGSRFLLIGVLMAAVCAVSWVVAPIVKTVRYIATSPKLHRIRFRAAAAVAGAVAAGVLLLGVIPFRVAVVAPGVVRAREFSVVTAETAGTLVEILAPPGVRVGAGTPLVRLASPELEFAIAAAAAQQDEIEARLLEALDARPANVQPLRSALHVVQARRADLEARRETLVVRARHEGLWSAPGLEGSMGAWFDRGAPVGHVVDAREIVFHAVIAQSDAVRFFGLPVRRASIRLRGEAACDIAAPEIAIVPGEQRLLPSAALGWAAGGEVAVDMQDASGRRTIEPFFEVRAPLPPDAPAVLLHGRTGRIRFTFEPEPLIRQWSRKLRQLIQKRYQF